MNKKITTHLFTILTTFCVFMGYSPSPVFANGGYRTIGLPTPNSIPVPVVHSVAQRAGTNIVDIDFEITDQDDETATVGILAAIDGDFSDPSKWIVPKGIVEGTENKIGKPISTNQTHRVSWYVKSDFTDLSADFQIGIFSQDARRSKPVDLHFLELPVQEGNLVISRSPVTTEEIIFYFRYLLSVNDPRVKLELTPDSETRAKIVNSEGTSLVEEKDSGSYNYTGSGTGQQYETAEGRDFFMQDFGSGYRWASDSEVTLAKEAATPGQINRFVPTKQIGGLPVAVNEYGFDPSWIYSPTYFPFPGDPTAFYTSSLPAYTLGNYGTGLYWVVKEN